MWDLPYIHPTCMSKIELTDDVPSILLHGDVTIIGRSKAHRSVGSCRRFIILADYQLDSIAHGLKLPEIQTTSRM